MTSTLRDICFDCANGRTAGEFWQAVLGGELFVQESGDSCVTPAGGSGLRYWFNQVPEPKTVKNRVHIDINMPDDAELERIIALGARKLQEIRGEDGSLWWTILADVEGMANPEIADLLGLSVSAVKSRLHRGRLLMRQALAPHFEEAAP